MAYTTAGAFNEFGEALKPTPTEQVQIAGRRVAVTNVLTNNFPSTSTSTSTLPFSRVDVIGSCDRNTVIRPVDDVDLLAIFDGTAWPKYQYDSRSFIYRVRNVLNGHVTAGARGQAVRLEYASGPRVDVAPVFWRGAGLGYWLPNGSGGWIATDPGVHKTYLAGRSTALSGHLRPMSRLVKAWNRAHSERLSSFHIEVMLASYFSSLGGNYRDALMQFFDGASIHVNDPAGHGGNLASRFTRTQQETATNALRAAGSRARLAVDAEARGDHQEAMRQWRIVLSSAFPAYG